jgi:hypothetical protein
MKTHTISRTHDRTGSLTLHTGTVTEISAKCSYTLECGAAYSHEKGNKKINRHPTTIGSLVNNLNNAINNSAANGYAGVTFALVKE